MALDLHGCSVHEGWLIFKDAMNNARHRGVRKLTVITGKGRMLDEFQNWADVNPNIREVQLREDGGSFKVWLHKN